MDEMEFWESLMDVWWIIVAGLVVLVVLWFLILLLERKFKCWYWKINERIALLEKTNEMLSENLIQIKQSNIQLNYISEVLYAVATNKIVKHAGSKDPSASQSASEPAQVRISDLHADVAPQPQLGEIPVSLPDVTPVAILTPETIEKPVVMVSPTHEGRSKESGTIGPAGEPNVLNNESDKTDDGQVENEEPVIESNVGNDSEEG